MQRSPWKLASFNAENMYMLLDRSYSPQELAELDEERYLAMNTSIYNPNKPRAKLAAIAGRILEEDMDIVGLCEVGGMETLRNFNHHFLDNRYECFLHHRNSNRGIFVGALVKRGRFTSVRAANISGDFSRNLLKLRIADGGTEVCLYVLHLKSPLGEDHGIGQRLRELEQLAAQVERQACVVMGDFNGIAIPGHAQFEFEAWLALPFRDVLHALGLPPERRYTHFYFGSAGPSFNQLDYIFCSNDLHILGGGVLEETIPLNFQQRQRLPSDHLFVTATIEAPGNGAPLHGTLPGGTMSDIPQLPVGWISYHRDPSINFQLNRWHSMGLARHQDFLDAAAKIDDFSDWKQQMLALAESAEAEGRILNQACYYRAAEFFSATDDPDKTELYRRCVSAFDRFLATEPVERLDMDYRGGSLPILRLRALGKSQGTVLVHGGYDSFNEELYLPMKLLSSAGWDVVLFEGPGQGRPLHRDGMVMTPAWEEPTSAVLDFLGLEEVSLVGISLGGYLGLRAAAFDPRIRRVVAFDIIWDFYKALMRPKPLLNRLIIGGLLRLKAKTVIDAMEVSLRAQSLFADWLLSQGYAVYGVDSLFDYLNTIRLYNSRGISSRIRADVLLLTGEDDLYRPFLDAQRRALTAAASVETRLFTRDEHASHHCQVGNLGLAVEVITDWLRRKTPAS